MTLDEKLARVKALAAEGKIIPSFHTELRMKKRAVSKDDIAETIAGGGIIEDYPQDPRGASCLINGITKANRPLHVVCTTELPELIIISVYEPTPPKWPTPTKRRAK